MNSGMRSTEFVCRLVEWGTTHVRKFPWRSSQSPLEVLIAEMLLQKTPAQRVAERFDDLVSSFTVESETLNPEALVQRFHDMGLTKRIRWLVSALQAIDKRFGGTVPDKYEELVSLPGVGSYTANAVLCVAFGKRVPMVDVNATRVLSRVFGLSQMQWPRDRFKFEEFARRLIPDNDIQCFNLSLMDLGALVCRMKPKCSDCPVLDACCFALSNNNEGSTCIGPVE